MPSRLGIVFSETTLSCNLLDALLLCGSCGENELGFHPFRVCHNLMVVDSRNSSKSHFCVMKGNSSYFFFLTTYLLVISFNFALGGS